MSDDKEQPQSRSGRSVVPKPQVWDAPVFGPADAAAIQALQRGDATPDQQKRGLDWIINSASNYYDLSFRPDALGGSRATDFAEGRRYVGAWLILLTKIQTSKLNQE